VDLVVVQWIPPIAVVAIALATGGGNGWVQVKRFTQTFETGEPGGDVRV
jgi:DNA-binding transcriptional regulator of glucitol operon